MVLETDGNVVKWSPPAQPNGIITVYRVIYSIYQNNANMSEMLNSSTTMYPIDNLSKSFKHIIYEPYNSTYSNIATYINFDTEVLHTCINCDMNHVYTNLCNIYHYC